MSAKSKRRQEQAKARSAKRASMFTPGNKSRYAQRVQARLRGEPMATRPVMPWHYESVMRAVNALRPEHREAFA